MLLDVHQLYVDLGGENPTPVLRGVTLRVHPGEVHGLVGESGAGKTMLARSVLGLLPANARVTHGYINFDEHEISRYTQEPRRQLLGRDITLIPQNPMTALNPVKRIEPQLTDVLKLHLEMSDRAARSRALELLHAVHMREPEKVLKLYPHELSGGMRQRVLIAIAFACAPKLIIADEPTTALDVTVQRQILRLIKELQASAGTAILFITHDLGVVAKICDRVSVIFGGMIVECGDARELFARPKHAYTHALLAATPRFDRPGDALKPVAPEIIDHMQQEIDAHDGVKR
jgi:peptide/nickel transport system ATP-binding protein